MRQVGYHPWCPGPASRMTIVPSVVSVPAVRSLAEIRSEDELSQLFPETMFPVYPEGGDSLEGSMELLKKGLESGTVLIQFEVRGSQGLSLPQLLSLTMCPCRN